MIDAPELSEFGSSKKTFLGATRAVYRIGDAGPGVILIHEIPGMTPNVLRLAKLLSLQGFRVALPSLFGKDGGMPSDLLDGEMLLKMCVNAEFAVFAANGSSPVIDWLRELCKDFSRDTNGSIGVIGLCITGGFALSLTVDVNGVVKAPIMSEPSLPFPLPLTKNGAAMHLSDTEEKLIRADVTPCVALRFTNDYICRRERFDSYQSLLGGRLVRIEILSPDPAHEIGAHAHAVLTEELRDGPNHPTWSAFERVIGFLSTQLRT
jgi:dienelactone hydrolase